MTEDVNPAELAKYATRDRAISVELTYGELYARPTDSPDSGDAYVIIVGTGGGLTNNEVMGRTELMNQLDRAVPEGGRYSIGPSDEIWPRRFD